MAATKLCLSPVRAQEIHASLPASGGMHKRFSLRLHPRENRYGPGTAGSLAYLPPQKAKAAIGFDCGLNPGGAEGGT